ncbi:TRAP transporter small permease [Thalassotalea sp. PLHSN55]|uniref:TRAP transporter small permease n=1 Tax=Thalassotalea sp. PLHSN55 TaxID=3435888 RepID=UPI003F856D13
MTDYKISNNLAPQESNAFSFNEEEQHFAYSDYKIEDWLAFVLFWLLAITVFSQFVSRYVFSAPLGWTEEVARYQLVCLGFIGACVGIRKNTHIFVALFHRWLPKQVSVNLYKVIAVCNVLFIAALAYFAWQIMPLLHIHKMASVALPISVLYGVIFASLLIMLLRSSQYLFSIFINPQQLCDQNSSASCD